MIDRRCAGQLPAKPHTAFRAPNGALRFEHCLTRNGFDGAYTIAYHQNRPHLSRPAPDLKHGWTTPTGPLPALAKRHFRPGMPPQKGGAPINTRTPLLFNDDVVLSVLFPSAPDPVYLCNGDGDDLFFIHQGAGHLQTLLGDLTFATGDYVFIPKGLLHRFVPEPGVSQHWLSIEFLGGMHIPAQFRNPVGQLRMDAPYGHRDFRSPDFTGPDPDGPQDIVVKRANTFTGFHCPHPPRDIVGWDGSVYPWVFPILAFQPRVGAIHLPPTTHTTFAARGALVCSFVPRPLDFHPDAIPCPYPHSSVDCDEFIFYSRGNFTSRRGVGPGSMSLHPAGIPHGPHPGAYESSIGVRSTDEVAVMLDTTQPLHVTDAGLQIEDQNYDQSFSA